MAIPKYTDPGRGRSPIEQEQMDHGEIHVVKKLLDPAALDAAMEKVHRAGMPGVFAEVRDGDKYGAARPASPMSAPAVPQPPTCATASAASPRRSPPPPSCNRWNEVRLELDAPVGHYLPRLVPGERGQAIRFGCCSTTRAAWLNTFPMRTHHSKAFPKLADTTPESLDDNRFKQFQRTDLINMGVTAPPVGTPGGTPGMYSNTNYLLLGQLLEQVTGTTAEDCITRSVIERAGLRHTELPVGPRVDGPHSRMYEAWFGMIDPPRDYSVFDMSWVGPAASLISTVADLNRFFGMLLAGEIVDRSSLAQMQSTVPVISQEGKKIEYGLGLHRREVPGCGTFWGHDGSVWGGGAMSMRRRRQTADVRGGKPAKGGTSWTPRGSRALMQSTRR